MRLLDTVTELLAPTRCAGCELPGSLLCPTCDEALPRIAPAHACPACGAPYGHLVCTECWRDEFAFEEATALGVLDGALARAVVLHKDAGERRLGVLLGGLLGHCAAERWEGWADCVTWVPATRRALVRRGFDHARSIAVPVAEQLGVPLRELLCRGRALDQRALGRAERAANAAEGFRIRGMPAGRVVLVDDVLTTGATLDAAAALLLDAGARAVRVAVVARAW